jgi:mono/diheme cytochrome c family protein
MQKRILIMLLIAVGGVFFITSCTSDTLVPEKIDPGKKVSFSSDIQPIFNANCISCHSGNTAPDLREGKSYSSLISGNYINKTAPNQSVLYIEMAPNGGMSSYTNASEAQLVLLWIQQGANEK